MSPISKMTHRLLSIFIAGGLTVANWDTEGSPVFLLGNLTIASADKGKVFELDANLNVTLTLGSFNVGDVFVVSNSSVTGKLTLTASIGTIDDVVSRVLLPNESAILYWTGVQFIKLGGRTVPIFVSVDIPQDSVVAPTQQAFAQTLYSNVVEDPLGLWNTSTKVFTSPRTSKYIMTVGLRIKDNEPSFSFVNGVHTAPVDGSWLVWYQTNQNAGITRRNGSQTARTVTAAVGSTWMGYYYIDYAPVTTISAASFTIQEVPSW
jgi:hypothetical protein